MRWAICPSLGILVDADDIDQVNRCHSDFICPVCYIGVTYRRRSYDGRSACFVHPDAYRKITPCPLRTIGSNISINEGTLKAPFPLILTRDGDCYHLNIKFRSLPNNYSNYSKIWLYNNGIQLKFQISDIQNGDNIKGISKPPQFEDRFLHADGDDDAYKLLNKWGSYIDYFKGEGALFEYNTGKKVPVQKAVYCDTDYLFIPTSNNHSFQNLLNSICIEKSGDLRTGDISYPVYHIKLPEYRNDDVIKFCKMFDNPLVEKKAEPFLIWPPAIRNKETYNTIWSNSSIFVSINKSENREMWIASQYIKKMYANTYEILDDENSILDLHPYQDDFTVEICQKDSSDSISISRNNAIINMSNNIEEDIGYSDSKNKADDISKATSISTNFIYNIKIIDYNNDIHLYHGSDKIKISDDMKSIHIYNYHLALVKSISKDVRTNKTDPIFRETILNDRPLQPVPTWTYSAIRNIIQKDPTLARIMALKLDNSLTSTKLLQYLNRWR